MVFDRFLYRMSEKISGCIFALKAMLKTCMNIAEK